MSYRIETKGPRSEWTSDGMGDGTTSVPSLAEAEVAVDDLIELGAGWEWAAYRVVNEDDGTVEATWRFTCSVCGEIRDDSQLAGHSGTDPICQRCSEED